MHGPIWRELKETLEQLRELAVQMQGRQPAVAKNLSYNARLFGEYLSFAGGGPVDTEYLEEEIRLSASLLHQQQVCMVLADVYHSRGQFGDERRLLTEVWRSRRQVETQRNRQTAPGSDGAGRPRRRGVSEWIFGNWSISLWWRTAKA